jgi:His/Glu/Gln/Arg/opine family amino acid ABC transporter permease subunit
MDVDLIVDSMPKILEGAGNTLTLFLWSMLWGTVAGLVMALMRLSRVTPLRWLSAILGWILRGIPLLVLLFYAFFVLPEVNVNLSAFWAAVVGLSAWTAGYQSEVIRSGILAVDLGQWEASEALAMTKRHYMRRIIIPQGVRIMIPPFMSNAMTLLKQTSVASVVTVPEMTLMANRLISVHFRPMELLGTVAGIYLVYNTVLVLLQQFLEKKTELKV